MFEIENAHARVSDRRRESCRASSWEESLFSRTTSSSHVDPRGFEGGSLQLVVPITRYGNADQCAHVIEATTASCGTRD